METTKAALESERKIQMLQTEAISALWKQMSALQPSTGQSSSVNMTSLSADNAEVVKELAKTCTVLQNQVRFLGVGCFYKTTKYLSSFQIQQLQNSMQDIIKVMTVFSQATSLNPPLTENGIATQTEIVAVHTPQVSEFGLSGQLDFIFRFQKRGTPGRRFPFTSNKRDRLRFHCR
jgi:hypothetical protein